MAAPLGRAVGNAPRLLRATYLAQNEGMLRETRATALFYFPGPVLLVLILLGLDLGAYSSRHNWSTMVPGLTSAFTRLGNYNADALTYTWDLLVILTLLALIWLIVRYFRWISTVYAVTSLRVIVQKGIFGRDFDEIPLLQIRGVDVHQTFGQRMLGYGTMWVSSEGPSAGSRLGNEAWKGIPRPFEFQRLVESASQGLATRNQTGFR
ncbi:MAG: PH domain-containing protein [Thermoplasmata archaeon]|nr:PH domain-containing protein [Thermoplasmata archaeon]